MKIIGKEVWEQSLFVQCECTEEIIEFCNDDEGEYFIRLHGYYDRKKDRYSDFTFWHKGQFSVFVSFLRDFINGIPSAPKRLYDKYFSYKNKKPGILHLEYAEDFFSIRKYANDKAKKCTWEVILRNEQAIEVYNELECWR